MGALIGAFAGGHGGGGVIFSLHGGLGGGCFRRQRQSVYLGGRIHAALSLVDWIVGGSLERGFIFVSSYLFKVYSLQVCLAGIPRCFGFAGHTGGKRGIARAALADSSFLSALWGFLLLEGFELWLVSGGKALWLFGLRSRSCQRGLAELLPQAKPAIENELFVERLEL